MTKPEFVYVTYIATTPEKVFQALVDTDIARQFWMGEQRPRARERLRLAAGLTLGASAGR